MNDWGHGVVESVTACGARGPGFDPGSVQKTYLLLALDCKNKNSPLKKKYLALQHRKWAQKGIR